MKSLQLQSSDISSIVLTSVWDSLITGLY